MLKNRLRAIANFVDKDDKIVDIGCDHSLLAIHLIKENIIEKAIVSDINPNALNNAIKNIKKENLEDKITPILSDGLKNIPTNEINTIIISGMGTTNILKILTNIPNNITKLIIQSNNNYYDLRKVITNNNFYIIDETITKKNNKYYLTIKFEKGKQNYKLKDCLFGIIKKENLDYYQDIKKKYETILEQIPKYRLIPRKRLQKLINKLNKIIKNFE